MDRYEMSIEIIKSESIVLEISGDTPKEIPGQCQPTHHAPRRCTNEDYACLLRKIARVTDEHGQWKRACVVASYLVPGFEAFCNYSSSTSHLRRYMKEFHDQVQRCRANQNDDAQFQTLVSVAQGLFERIETTLKNLPADYIENLTEPQAIELQFLSGFVEKLRPFTEVQRVQNVAAISRSVQPPGAKPGLIQSKVSTSKTSTETENTCLTQYTKKDFLAYVHQMIDTLNPLAKPTRSDYTGAKTKTDAESQPNNFNPEDHSATLNKGRCCNDGHCSTSLVDAAALYDTCFPARPGGRRLFELQPVRPPSDRWETLLDVCEERNFGNIGDHYWPFDFDIHGLPIRWGVKEPPLPKVRPIIDRYKNVMLSKDLISECDVRTSIYNANELLQQYDQNKVVADIRGMDPEELGFPYASYSSYRPTISLRPSRVIKRESVYVKAHPYKLHRKKAVYSLEEEYEREIRRQIKYRKYVQDLNSDALYLDASEQDVDDERESKTTNGEDGGTAEIPDWHELFASITLGTTQPGRNENGERRSEASARGTVGPHGTLHEQPPERAELPKDGEPDHTNLIFNQKNRKCTEKPERNEPSTSKDQGFVDQKVTVSTPRSARLAIQLTAAAGQAEQEPSRKLCSFCQQSGRTQREYFNHNRTDPATNITICPVLRLHICRFCLKTGDEAHTLEDCEM